MPLATLSTAAFHDRRSLVRIMPPSTPPGPPSTPPASLCPRRTAGCEADSATLRAQPRASVQKVGRALSQLGTDRAEADDDEPTITNEEAKDASAKAQHVVEVIERAIAAGLGPAPPP
jgi:hypothetical protein